MVERFEKDNIIALATTEDDENTCILCIELTDGVLFSHGKRYHIDFTAE